MEFENTFWIIEKKHHKTANLSNIVSYLATGFSSTS